MSLSEAEVITYETDPGLLDGVQAVSSVSPSYYSTLAMIAAGQAKFMGERYGEDGSRVILVGFGEAAHQNPPPPESELTETIGVNAHMYSTVLKEYEDWPEKWWREVVQNAVDSGTDRIDLTCEELAEDGSVLVSCRDYGKGMDQETLLGKFLMLGGTSKVDASGATGGFGKAKELIILPWLNWMVSSRDLEIFGIGMKHSKPKVVTPIQGTMIRVAMPADQHTTEAAAVAFIKKCNLPQVKFRVNGKIVKADLSPDRRVEDLGADKGVIYHNPADRMSSPQILVRTNGLYSFGIGISSSVPGTVIFELTGKSTDHLTANRDGFRGSLRWEIERFVSKIAADTKSALRNKAGAMRTVFKGTEGQFKPDLANLRSEVLREVEFKKGKGKLKAQELDKIIEVINQADEALKHARPGSWVEDKTSDQYRVDAETARAALASLDMSGPTHAENALKQLAWAPDFYIINEKPDAQSWENPEIWKVPKRFLPEHMPPGLRRLARLWAELCRLVLIQLGSGHEYGVGWIFSEGAGAAYTRDQGTDWLLLNPFAGASMRKGKLRGTSESDLDELYALAIHECTHLADGVDKHDEAFSTALTYNIAKTLGGQKQARAVRRAVVARKFEAGTREQEQDDEALEAKYGQSALDRDRKAKEYAKKQLETVPTGNWYEVTYGRTKINGQEGDWSAIDIDGDARFMDGPVSYKPLQSASDPWIVASTQVKAFTKGEIQPQEDWFPSFEAMHKLVTDKIGVLASLGVQLDMLALVPGEEFTIRLTRYGA